MATGKRSKKVVLPLLTALRSVPPNLRVILLSHLDNSTRDRLYETISHVLKSNRVPFAKKLFLKSKLLPYKDQLRFLADKKKSSRSKKQRLAQIGGGPMTHVLGTAIPLLLNLYSKP